MSDPGPRNAADAEQPAVPVPEKRRRLPAPAEWGLKFMVAAACAVFVARKVPWAQVGPSLAHCRIAFLLLAVLLQYGMALANASRWKALARTPGLGLSKYLYFVLLGNFFNLFLPGSMTAEAVKVFAFGRKYGGTQENIGIALVAKTAGMLVQALLGGAGLLFYARDLARHGVFAKAQLNGRSLAILGAIILLGGGAAWAMRRRLKAQIWFRTMVAIAQDRRLVAAALFWSALIQVGACVGAYWLFLSLWPDTHFWQVVLFSTLVLAALSLPFGFGGMGVREYLNLVLFTDLGGIPAQVTFAVTLIGYVPILALALTGGAWMAYRKIAI